MAFETVSNLRLTYTPNPNLHPNGAAPDYWLCVRWLSNGGLNLTYTGESLTLSYTLTLSYALSNTLDW